jgi:hypothetical protein
MKYRWIRVLVDALFSLFLVLAGAFSLLRPDQPLEIPAVISSIALMCMGVIGLGYTVRKART